MRLRRARDHLHPALRPFFWCMFTAETRRQRSWRYPAGPAVVRVAGPEPVRILVVGDGPAAGCGVLIHELGIAGGVARHVAEASTRGVEVTVDAQPLASARSTHARLGGCDLTGYDVIVVMLAATDACCLTPPRRWRESLTGLVQSLTASGAPSVLVTLADGAHLTRSLPRSPRALRLVADHARALNAETGRICAESGTPTIALDAVGDLTPDAYARWGGRIGSRIVAAMGEHRPPEPSGAPGG